MVSLMASDLVTDERADVVPGTAREMVIDSANGRPCGAIGGVGDAALEVEVALGELAAGIRRAKAEVRRMLAGSAGWAARGAWSSAHPSLGP
jgi:hypothetical protein